MKQRGFDLLLALMSPVPKRQISAAKGSVDYKKSTSRASLSTTQKHRVQDSVYSETQNGGLFS